MSSSSATGSDRGGLSRTPAALRILDQLTGGILLFAVVFAPWSLGGTVTWSIVTMTALGYALGVLLIAKWLVRWRLKFAPARWDEDGPHWPIRLLAVLTVVTLAYCLTSGLNARATAEVWGNSVRFTYRETEGISWLPQSYDGPRSLRAFWRYLGLAAMFWAARDWLLGKSRRERHADDEDEAASMLPRRLRVLLWTLSLSSTLLGLESILQRLDGTHNLLWIFPGNLRIPGYLFFGPYTYRTNAAQYFNLVWPVSLGLWWTLRKQARKTYGINLRAGSQSYVVLLPCTVLMAACPIIATSRGGALILFAAAVVALFILFRGSRSEGKGGRRTVGAIFLAALALGLALGGRELSDRFETVFTDQLSGRGEIYATSRKMAADFVWFGSGPETFTQLYGLYRANPQDVWQAYAHNDWLETRITFGRVGLALILALLALVPVCWLTRRCIEAPFEFTALLGLALGGCLAHAWFDFPFQVYSLLFLVVLLLAVATCISRTGSGAPRA